MEWNFSHLSASFPWLYSTMSLAAVMHALHSRPHISYPCNAEHCYRQQKVWFSTWMLPLLEGPCFWQSYHKLQGHCQGFSINRSWCALHASLMVGSFLLHAAISGGRDGPMLSPPLWRTVFFVTCHCLKQGLAYHRVVHWARLVVKQDMLRISLRCSTTF